MTSKRIRLTLDYTTTEPHAASDARSAMARAIQAARAVTTQLDSGNARSLSPCSEWNALDVVRHMIAVIDRATAGATGQSLHGMPELVDVELVDVDDAFAESSRALLAAWADDASLTSMLDVPWGTFPGAVVLAVYTADLLVHTWDLAVAIDVELNWPEPDVAASLEMAIIGFPDNTREGMPFEPVVRPEPNAPAIEHLAGWVGRDLTTWSVSR